MNNDEINKRIKKMLAEDEELNKKHEEFKDKWSSELGKNPTREMLEEKISWLGVLIELAKAEEINHE